MRHFLEDTAWASLLALARYDIIPYSSMAKICLLTVMHNIVALTVFTILIKCSFHDSIWKNLKMITTAAEYLTVRWGGWKLRYFANTFQEIFSWRLRPFLLLVKERSEWFFRLVSGRRRGNTIRLAFLILLFGNIVWFCGCTPLCAVTDLKHQQQ